MLVDILVGQIDASGKAHLTVNDHQLAVVSVVEPQGHHGDKAVKDPALDTPGGHLLVVVPGQGEHAAHVVVDEAHLHPLGRLFLQNVQNAVPEFSGLNNKVLQEDIVLGLFQLLQHPGKGQIAQGEILGLCVGVGGAAGVVFQVAGLAGGVLSQREQVVGLKVGLQVFRRLLGDALHAPGDAFGDVSAAHQQIEDAAEHREGEHQQQPGDLISWVDAAAQNQHSGYHAQGDAAPIKPLGVAREKHHHHNERNYLGQQGQPYHHRAVKQDIQHFFQGQITSVPG